MYVLQWNPGNSNRQVKRLYNVSEKKPLIKDSGKLEKLGFELSKFYCVF